jgi:hypothetical protein
MDKLYLSRKELAQWLERCSLNAQEMDRLISNVDFDLEGKISVGSLVNSEQYLRVLSSRNQRFLP